MNWPCGYGAATSIQCAEPRILIRSRSRPASLETSLPPGTLRLPDTLASPDTFSERSRPYTEIAAGYVFLMAGRTSFVGSPGKKPSYPLCRPVLTCIWNAPFEKCVSLVVG